MAVRVTSGVLRGVEATPIEVEVDLLRRLPGVCIVGLAAVAVREASERVRSVRLTSGRRRHRRHDDHRRNHRRRHRRRHIHPRRRRGRIRRHPRRRRAHARWLQRCGPVFHPTGCCRGP